MSIHDRPCRHRRFSANAVGTHWVCELCYAVLAPVTATLVTDATGSRWVEYPKRKKRKPPRAVRFANLKVGDILIWGHKDIAQARIDSGKPSSDWERHVVTDLWFDPVLGERDETAGRLLATRILTRDGTPTGRKTKHTLRGLASEGFHYADEYVARFERQVSGIAEQIDAIRKQATASTP